MEVKQRQDWTPAAQSGSKTQQSKRLLRNTAIFAVVSLCLGTGVMLSVRAPEQVQSVMNHLTAGFEYDETLGRLQFVSNVLPESAMVFLTSDASGDVNPIVPESTTATHVWNPDEPWIEYAHIGDVTACREGEIMNIVQNHQNAYTVRILHSNGYESVYSGLKTVHISEHDHVFTGQTIGTAAGSAAFELRKDGLSVLPAFASL